jgi:hypothetical protein
MKKASSGLPTIAAGGLSLFLVVLAVSVPHIGTTPKRARSQFPQHGGAAPMGRRSANDSHRPSGTAPTILNSDNGSHAQTDPLEAPSTPSTKVRAGAHAKSTSAFTDLGELVLGSSSGKKTGIVEDQDRVQVWISRSNGYYYCADSRYYERLRPGAFMAQGKALQSGYQPKLGQLCD